MGAQTVTLISGVAFLGVFVLVGWNRRRHRAREEHAHKGRAEEPLR